MNWSHVSGSVGGDCIRRICPSTNTAEGAKGAARVNARGISSLNALSQLESIVIQVITRFIANPVPKGVFFWEEG